MGKKKNLWKYLIFAAILCPLIWMLIPELSTTHRNMQESMVIGSELKSVNYAMLQYADDNNDYLPLNGLITLYKQGYLPADCNFTVMKKFVYMGSGLQCDTSGGDGDVVSFFEPLEKHKKYANIAFTNGRVTMVTREEWNDVCRKYKIPSIYEVEY